MTIKNLVEEFNNITKMKVFEIEVFDNRTNEKDHILFEISIDEECKILMAEHVALTIEEEKSDYVACKTIDLNDVFSLDEHLAQLHNICIEAIINGDFYELV